MGSCLSDPTTKQSWSDIIINNELEIERNKLKRKKQILIMGSTDSGKTTIMKQLYQIKSVHNDEISEYIESVYGMNLYFLSEIRRTIFCYMKILCQESQKLEISMENKQNEDYRQWMIDNIDEEWVNCNMKIKSLWTDIGIKTTLQKYQQYDKLNNIHYFMDRMDEILSPHYQYMKEAQFKDFLKIKTKTNGIISETFISNQKQWGQYIFTYHEITESKTERFKWKYMVTKADIDHIIFVFDISQYSVDKLTVSLQIFNNMIKWRSLPITIFFNKYELLLDKLKDPHCQTMKDMYDDWPIGRNPMDPDKICEFVYERFLEVYHREYPNNNSTPHYHRICALDTDQIDVIVQDVELDCCNVALEYI